MDIRVLTGASSYCINCFLTFFFSCVNYVPSLSFFSFCYTIPSILSVRLVGGFIFHPSLLVRDGMVRGYVLLLLGERWEREERDLRRRCQGTKWKTWWRVGKDDVGTEEGGGEFSRTRDDLVWIDRIGA
jgi:hypothetical protein